MGGRVGLKGTDGVINGGGATGAERVANTKALAMLHAFKHLLEEKLHPPLIGWVSADGDMGCDALRDSGFAPIKVAHRASGQSSALDTKTAVEKFPTAGVDLVLFCGGDGTARDVCTVTGEAHEPEQDI